MCTNETIIYLTNTSHVPDFAHTQNTGIINTDSFTSYETL